ncbi:hypothetical protein CK220_20060 [Mesorhizobium sp. WSM3860]|nr:hypothetical protein CK220_20060 [Mesorhizobium sp. WSM3860]
MTLSLNQSVQASKATRITAFISTWRERLFYRNELARLARDAPHMIDDIGLTEEEVELELAKPFWR